MRRLAVLGCLLLAAVIIGRAQQAAPADPAAIPIEQEPRHRLVFANEFVRIIDAMLPPLYVSQNHTHTYDNVAVTILTGLEGAQAQSRVGFAGYSRGGYSHIITNPNTAPMRFIAVELRAPDHSVESEEVPQADHVTVLDNARVHIARVKLAAGESVAGHQHAAGYVSVVVRGLEPAGTWRWHASGEPAASLDAGRQSLEIVEVEPK